MQAVQIQQHGDYNTTKIGEALDLHPNQEKYWFALKLLCEIS